MAKHNNLSFAVDLGKSNIGLSARLSEVSWDFSEKRKASAIDGLHPYPAKFIPEIPGALLDSLALRPDALIFDPFCGSGTTLAEAQRRNFEAVGVDLNPIAWTTLLY